MILDVKYISRISMNAELVSEGTRRDHLRRHKL
jgi:hypothetical protein